jgi:hypothetical protein
MITLKFNSNGLPLWTSPYNGYGSGADLVYDMEIDDAGNVYVCGGSMGNQTDFDFVTMRYNSLGIRMWVNRVNGPGSGSDYAQSLELDIYRNVYVSGAVTIQGQSYNFATLKYTWSTGAQVGAMMMYNGTGSNYDAGNSIAVTSNGSGVYVCGPSEGSGTSGDIAVVKYSQLVGIENIESELPNDFSLSQNYPNPFNPATNIKFSIPVSSNVKITVFDVQGKLVDELVNKEMNPGVYVVDWDASALSSGTYFYTIRTESFTETKKMILIK